MTVKQLIEHLQKNYHDIDNVLIDNGTDGGFSSERNLLFEDIHHINENTILITTSY